MVILQLNDMRAPKIEILTPVARAETRQELEAFMAREKVEYYQDGKWGKNFRKGGPLEWYNEPWFDHESFIDIGTIEEAIERTRQNWNSMLADIPTIPIDVPNVDFAQAELLVCAGLIENVEDGILLGVCSVCDEPQYQTPAGPCCTNGHGGAPTK